MMISETLNRLEVASGLCCFPLIISICLFKIGKIQDLSTDKDFNEVLTL